MIKKIKIAVKHQFTGITGYILLFLNKYFVQVRLGKLLYERIGHFCPDFVLYCLENHLAKKKVVNIYIYNGTAANKAWENIFLRNAKVFPQVLLRLFDFDLFKKKFPRLIFSTHFNDTTRDAEGLVLQCPTYKWLDKKENNRAKLLLNEFGWSGQPIITLHVRDSGYLDKNFIHKRDKSDAWSYHSYRNSEIETYVEVVDNLIKKGFFVIRIGKNTSKRLPLYNSNYIDCWHDGLFDDIIDIWAALNSYLMISTSSGIDLLSCYSGVPVCFVNAMPLKSATTFSNCLWVPKNCYWKEAGRALTFHEMIIHSYFRTEDYQAAGIILEDLTSDEITDGVVESLQRIDGKWQVSEDELAIIRKIEKILMSNPNFDKEYGFFHPRFSFGMNWIRSKGPGFLE